MRAGVFISISAFALSYYSHMKGLKIELGSDRVLGIPLDIYIPSEQVAFEVNIGSEDMEILKEHLCQQRGIKRIKLPMKTNETEIAYAQRIKAAFQSVHIFITSDTEEDVRTIKNYLRTGGTANERKEISYLPNSRRTEQSYSVTYPLKNELLEQGKYTDAVDDVLCKVYQLRRSIIFSINYISFRI